MINIEVVREESTEKYSCEAFKIRDGHYLYLYDYHLTNDAHIKQIVPMNDKSIVEINFSRDL